MEAVKKPKKLKVAFPERAANNFFNICELFRSVDPDTKVIEDYIKVHKTMCKALSKIITIMENGHETDHGDIKDINVVKLNSKKDIEIKFSRYIQCKLQPITVIVQDFNNKGVVEINPAF